MIKSEKKVVEPFQENQKKQSSVEHPQIIEANRQLLGEDGLHHDDYDLEVGGGKSE